MFHWTQFPVLNCGKRKYNFIIARTMSAPGGCVYLAPNWGKCSFKDAFTILSRSAFTVNVKKMSMEVFGRLLEYEVDTWPILKTVYGSRGEYACHDGLCLLIKPFERESGDDMDMTTPTPTQSGEGNKPPNYGDVLDMLSKWNPVKMSEAAITLIVLAVMFVSGCICFWTLCFKVGNKAKERWRKTKGWWTEKFHKHPPSEGELRSKEVRFTEQGGRDNCEGANFYGPKPSATGRISKIRQWVGANVMSKFKKDKLYSDISPLRVMDSKEEVKEEATDSSLSYEVEQTHAKVLQVEIHNSPQADRLLQSSPSKYHSPISSPERSQEDIINGEHYDEEGKINVEHHSLRRSATSPDVRVEEAKQEEVSNVDYEYRERRKRLAEKYRKENKKLDDEEDD